jgi:predicted DNA-binding transcriptional regulator AlpA
MTQTALTIAQFCQTHSISRNLFYNLKKQGLAPKMIAVGKRRLISIEAAAEWRRTMESHSSAT